MRGSYGPDRRFERVCPGDRDRLLLGSRAGDERQPVGGDPSDRVVGTAFRGATVPPNDATPQTDRQWRGATRPCPTLVGKCRGDGGLVGAAGPVAGGAGASRRIGG